MENLRLLLSRYNSSDPIWIGCGLFAPISNQLYPNGGAGYVLSRASLRAFGDTVRKSSPPKCAPYGSLVSEDVRFALCLESIGVRLIDGQAPNGFRFFPTSLEHFMVPKESEQFAWIYQQRRGWVNQVGPGLCSCCILVYLLILGNGEML